MLLTQFSSRGHKIRKLLYGIKTRNMPPRMRLTAPESMQVGGYGTSG